MGSEGVKIATDGTAGLDAVQGGDLMVAANFVVGRQTGRSVAEATSIEDAGGWMTRIPGWERWSWLAAGFSGRAGGVSTAYGEGELNLGFTPEDDAGNVEENRRRAVREVGGGDWTLVVVRQVHGVEVREVHGGSAASAMPDGRGVWEADGLVSREPGWLLGVGAADCVPVLMADLRQRAVGAFHAGWRGTAAGMAGCGLRRMAELFGTKAEDCVAAVGPSIGRCCYEVDAPVRDGLLGGPAAEDVEVVLSPGAGEGRWRLDLWGANRRQLVRAGVRPEAITVMGECTACTREQDGRRRYFSHRAEGGRTGRMLGVIGVRREGRSGI